MLHFTNFVYFFVHKYAMRNFIDIANLFALYEAQIDPERAARAAKMGFDTNRVWYTGTPNGEIEEFDPKRTPDELLAYGKGIYTTADPVAASGYSRPGASWGNDTEEAQPTVYPVFLKAQNPFDLEKRYAFPEVERILKHGLGDDLSHVELWRECMEDMGYTIASDDDADDDGEPDQRSELEWRLDELQHATSHEDIDPADYEEGESDPEYIEDVKYAIKVDAQSIERQLARMDQQETEETERRVRDRASGRRGGATGRDIYRALWTNSEGYYDWKSESRLFGGEHDVIEFKTTANEWLQELGYDAITHQDHYNPGQSGSSHEVMIVFSPNQVRSVFAKFDPEHEGTGNLSA